MNKSHRFPLIFNKKGIKKIIAFSTAAITGIFLFTAPVFAAENCSCTPGHLTENCSCGCAEAAANLKDAQARMDAASTNVTFTQRELDYSKKLADEAQIKESEAKEKKEAATAEYEKAVAAGTGDLNTFLELKEKSEEEYIKAEEELLLRLEYLRQDEENATLAQEELEKAENALDEAKSNMDEAEHMCMEKYYMSYDYRNEEVNLGFKFTDNDGKSIEGVKITMISTVDNSPVTVSVSDKDGMSYAKVNSLDKYKISSIEIPKGYALPSYDAEGHTWNGAMEVSFVEYTEGRSYPELGDKGMVYPIVTTTPESETLSASVKSTEYWDDDKRIDIVLNKIKEETNETVTSYSSNATPAEAKTENKITANNVPSVKTQSATKPVSIEAPQTGDNGYLQAAGYTILIVGITTSLSMIVFKKKRKA